MQTLFVLLVLSLAAKSFGFFWNKKQKVEGACGVGPCKIEVLGNGEWENGQSVELSEADCGAADFVGLICSRTGYAAGSSLFSSWGTEVKGCESIRPNDFVHVVPEGRLFMWPSREVGHKVEIRHMEMLNGKPIILETLSQRPRVFRLQNFFTEAEAEDLIDHALSIDEEAFKLKRSSTGATGYTVDSKRTSEGAFDVNSPTALNIKKRSFELLGIRPYDESFADGIQILRYNQTTAYISHMDWIEPTKLNNNHDWESAGSGTNRYATILLYLSGVEDGGETVFTQAKPIAEEGQGAVGLVTRKQAESETTQYLESKNLTSLFPEGTWQRNMIVECRSRMAVKPIKAEAILFYSQFPDGNVDRLSVHGGCPVLIGQKWAANLWVWNGPRNGYARKNPVTGKMERDTGSSSAAPVSVSASFDSEISVGAKLFWQDQEWGALIPGESIRVNTYQGHKWNVRLNGEVLLEWTIGDDPQQTFTLTQAMIN